MDAMPSKVVKVGLRNGVKIESVTMIGDSISAKILGKSAIKLWSFSVQRTINLRTWIGYERILQAISSNPLDLRSFSLILKPSSGGDSRFDTGGGSDAAGRGARPRNNEHTLGVPKLTPTLSLPPERTR